jgi:hypothetical protein
MMAEQYTPRVVCAAIRVGDQIICGARHYDGLMIQQIEGRNELGKWRSAEQGFVDQRGKWLTREDAWVVAEREKQIINDPEWCAGSLHSEHLY